MANKEFYRFARAYDIAFNGRDYKEECDFVEWCFENYADENVKNLDDKMFLELGAGPAHHAREFSNRSWKSLALDISPDMIEYAKQVSGTNGKLNFICDDMINYKLDDRAALTGNFTESISHILTNEDFVEHLKVVSKNSLPGGIYIIETAHPSLIGRDEEPNYWVSEEDDLKVEILFGGPADQYDPITQVWDVTTIFKIWENGIVKDLVESKSPHRWLGLQEFRALIELSGVVEDYWTFGTMEIPPKKIDDNEADCLIIVMKMKG